MPIPSDWSSSPLKHVTTVLNRGSAPDYVDDGPVRAVSQAANQPSGLDWSRTRFHEFSGDPQKLKGYLHAGDVIINSTGTGTLGRVGQFMGSPDGIPCMADGHVTIARADIRVLNPRFAYYWLSSKPFQEYVYAALVVGATNQIELNRERLGEAPVPLPPLDEQRRIADFLDAETVRIELLLAKRRRMNGLLALRRERITEQVLGLGEGHGARLVPLKYLVREVSVGIVVTPAKWYVDDGGVPALRGLNVQPGRILAEDLVRISDSGNLENRKSRLSAGDVVVVRTGQAGVAAVVPHELDGANCIDLIIIRSGDALDPHYLTYVLNSDYAMREVGLNSVGSIQAHFNVGAMKQLPIPNVSRDEQVKKVALLDRRIGEMNALSRRLAVQDRLLKERRQALITAAVTGQLDVTTARPVHDRDL
ncbi:restriction endonuclease subunit S [Streptomyces sp. C36]|uniref:restriction endonuclease subunit S n=1 Tax=Streptomyces sp. C36 TaxID=3237122 RepID=UPI0034C5F163